MTPEEKAREADVDLKVMMRTRSGRRVYWRITTQAGLHTSSYADSPTATAYNEGRRSVALALMAEVKRVCPESYVLAVREALEDAQRDANQAKNAAESDAD